MISRGTVNLVLNRLVREGAITSFKTNYDDPSSRLGLHIFIEADPTAEPGRPRQRMDRVRSLVRQALEGVADGATVSVRTRAQPSKRKPPMTGG
jgi:hypothetical protein